jgi:transcriptional regulator with XRE-family HTH domain
MAEHGDDWLSRTLTDLRKAAGLSQTSAALSAGFEPGAGQVRLSRIETGQFAPTEDEVLRLCDAYGASEAVRSLCLLWTARDTLDAAVSSRVILAGAAGHQRRLAAVEEASRDIRGWQPLLLPGLLQTPEYARAVFSDRLPAAEAEAAVAVRMARKSILDSGRSFTFVISEGALRWSAGPAVMRAQLGRLAEPDTRYRLGVIPQRQVVTTFPVHGFRLFDDRLVVIGKRHGAELIGDQATVRIYVEWFAQLEGLAVFGDEAREVIAAVAASYRAGGEG